MRTRNKRQGDTVLGQELREIKGRGTQSWVRRYGNEGQKLKGRGTQSWVRRYGNEGQK